MTLIHAKLQILMDNRAEGDLEKEHGLSMWIHHELLGIEVAAHGKFLFVLGQDENHKTTRCFQVAKIAAEKGRPL